MSPRAAYRACSQVGCGALVPAGTGACALCKAAIEAARPSPAERGYGADHRKLRARVARQVARGTVLCARCGLVIEPGTPWDLGHTDNRQGWSGAEHASCNRADGGRKGLMNRER